MSDIKYGNASLKVREHFSNKVKSQLNKSVTDQGLRFIKLTSIIPNWETYLTEKQREVAVRYLRTMNAYDVDYQLKLTNGTTHQRLFGSKTSKGAIGRLEEAYKILESTGYYEAQKQKQEAKQAEKNKIRLTEQSLQKVQELFRLIHEIPHYEQYITKTQKDKVDELIKTRSFVKGAMACNVSVESFQQGLIGDNGVLEKLKEAKEANTVNSWDDI